jgi:hypothetical protein
MSDRALREKIVQVLRRVQSEEDLPELVDELEMLCSPSTGDCMSVGKKAFLVFLVVLIQVAIVTVSWSEGLATGLDARSAHSGKP